MSPLNRKLLRDLWAMKGQAVAIASVMACGVALFVLSRSMLSSLELTQQTYYERFHFADVFASLKRAPDALAQRLAEIPGVRHLQTRIVVRVNLSVPGLDQPAVGKLISLPDTHPPWLNQVYLRSGRRLSPGRDDEVLASEAFASANRLQVGDWIVAVIHGRRKRLRIVGIGLSPEYIYEISPGELVPDNRHFGVFWMNHRALSMAYNLESAFNDLAISLRRDANLADVLERVDNLIDPYGGLGAYGRRDQLSHQFLDNEIKQNRNMGLFAPTIFLGVSAFLLNVVLSRLIHTQREQIAALKAFGYDKVEIGWHYLKLVLLLVAMALAVGIPTGLWFGHTVTAMYAKLFHFPQLIYRINLPVLSQAAIVSLAAAVLGTLTAVLRAARLQPAEAMRPEPPTGYGPTSLERLGLGAWLPPMGRMVLRQLERHPFKTALSTVAIALAAAVLVVGNFFDDSLHSMMNTQFNRVQRYDISVTTVDLVGARATYELSHMPGVFVCQPSRTVSVRLRAGPRHRRVGILGIRPDHRLLGLVDIEGHEARLPPGGLLLSQKLADVLAVRVGDPIQMEVLEGKRPVLRTRVAGTLEDFAGLSAYMNLTALHRLMREGPVITGATLRVDPAAQSALYGQLKKTPQVASVAIKENAVDSFNATVAENLRVMKSINLLFACIIAVGVVYNSAQISLSERSRELATLRVIGFSRREISTILLGELAVVTLLAIPLGLAMGYGMAWWMCRAFDQELFRFPLVVSHFTYAFSASVVLFASIFSGLLVRRRLDQLDLVAVLKSRE